MIKSYWANMAVYHACLVGCIGLFSGGMLTVSMLGGFEIWPFPIFEIEIPGSVRAWKTAHIGGLVNSIFMIAVILAATFVKMPEAKIKLVAFFMIITGWGNTIFYWAGALSKNRGLSSGDTPYGEADIWGLISYLGGVIPIPLTLSALLIVAYYAKQNVKSSKK